MEAGVQSTDSSRAVCEFFSVFVYKALPD